MGHGKPMINLNSYENQVLLPRKFKLCTFVLVFILVVINGLKGAYILSTSICMKSKFYFLENSSFVADFDTFCHK